eukprot:2669699-Rhodomonas_salina.1
MMPCDHHDCFGWDATRRLGWKAPVAAAWERPCASWGESVTVKGRQGTGSLRAEGGGGGRVTGTR